ncbi:hypothetical protein MESS2_1050042 [Mesorhizobium metallidurans STM 2683]|uniref:Uncharacterized protein n=1 Tax=Mesorhizobium metallidurans STM 2683 TaxID=1297569 RepID=M5EH33_9HYPH|nr:hypothetical protein MESS2_1050042 [Mesorhizobium metallidurans STM 2683]
MDFFRRLAFAHHQFRLDAELLAHLVRVAVEGRAGRRIGLLAHDLLDAQPVLEIVRLDHVKQHQHTARALRALRGVGDGALAFRRVVDDRQELAAMAGFAAEAFGDHVYLLGIVWPQSATAADRPQAVGHCCGIRGGNVRTGVNPAAGR